MAGRNQRQLKPVEAAGLILSGLLEAGIRNPREQVDAVISVLRGHFAKATREDDLLVAEVLRVLGSSESMIWALLQEWCEEFGREEGEVFEHVWAPTGELKE